MVNEAIVYHHLLFADKNITKGRIDDILGGTDAYLRRLQSLGAILGGKTWADPALNTKDVLSSGQLYIDFDFTAPSPLERLTFRSHLVDDYYEDILVGANQTVA